MMELFNSQEMQRLLNDHNPHDSSYWTSFRIGTKDKKI